MLEVPEWPELFGWQSLVALFAMVLFALYFIFEDAPCHYSRLAEGRYLTVCVTLLIVPLCSLERPCYSVRAAGAYDIMHLVMGALGIRLYYFLLQVQNLPPFYDQSDRRPFVEQLVRHRATSAIAARVVRELDASVRLVVRTDNDPQAHVLTRTILSMPSLLVLAAVQQLAFNYRRLAVILSAAARVLQLILLVTFLFLEMRRWLRCSRELHRLHSLILKLVESKQQDVLQEVLAVACVPILLLAARDDTKELLTSRALEDGLLDTASKAILVNALQKRGIGKSRHTLEAVTSLLLSCTGYELTKLKSLLDSTGSYYTFYKLVYEDIGNEELRERVLDHLSSEALTARMLNGGALGVKILSDIDDTFCSSGGSYPAGCDTRMPKHCIYPGICRLLQELDQGWNPQEPSANIVFLSARPHIYKDLAEHKSYRLFMETFNKGQLHSVPTLLPGSLGRGLWSVLGALCCQSKGWKPVGKQKAKAFQHYQALYKEYDFVFCGDNGQGDLLAGECMLATQEVHGNHFVEGEADTASDSSDREDTDAITSSRWEKYHRRPVPSSQPHLLAILIHEVLPVEQCLALEPVEKRTADWSKQLASKGIFLHATYAGAALALYNIGILTAMQLRSVTVSALDDFDRARMMFPEWIKGWGQFELNFEEDLQRVGAVLLRCQLPALPPMRETVAYAAGLSELFELPNARNHSIGSWRPESEDSGSDHDVETLARCDSAPGLLQGFDPFRLRRSNTFSSSYTVGARPRQRAFMRSASDIAQDWLQHILIGEDDPF